MTDPRRPWSTDETLLEMQACADALGGLAGLEEDPDDAIVPILALARHAARSKWAAKRARAAAIEDGAIAGLRNDKAREAKILAYQIEPNRSIADLEEEAEIAAEELAARKVAIGAVIEQGRLIQSAHVTGRQAAER